MSSPPGTGERRIQSFFKPPVAGGGMRGPSDYIKPGLSNMLSRKRPASRPRQPGLCFSCGEVGHYANSCPKRRARPGAGAADAADTAGPADSNSDVKRELPSFLAQHRYRPTGDSSAGAARKGRVLVPEQTEEAKPSPDLSVEQRRVVDLVLDGHNVFFTGNAGTGKSFALREIVRLLRSRHSKEEVYVTASTGIAACNVGGTTIHSFAGIGLGRDSKDKLVAKVMRDRRAAARWRVARALVVDEISMLDGDLFDKINAVAQRVRNRPQPFGGVQLILCGDFFQLPPVGLGKSPSVCFAFQTQAWREAVNRVVVLRQVFRQKEDDFVRLLQEVRDGAVTPRTTSVLTGLSTATLASAPGIEPTRLYARNRDVDAMNNERLIQLPGEETTFRAKDWGARPELGMLQRNCPAPETLTLKKDTQVILLKNLDPANGLVNGTRGVVIDFRAPDVNEAGEDASRAPMHPLPVVKFHVSPEQTVERKLGLESWTVEVGGQKKAERKQVPLKLAWALSIHKSQGMTIPLLEISLAGVFEYGQAYVALSRATSLRGLRVIGFSTRIVKTHPHVKAFHDKAIHASENDVDLTEEPTDAAPPSDGWVSARRGPERAPAPRAKFQTAKALHQQDASLVRAHIAATGGGAQHAPAAAGSALAALHAAVGHRNV